MACAFIRLAASRSISLKTRTQLLSACNYARGSSLLDRLVLNQVKCEQAKFLSTNNSDMNSLDTVVTKLKNFAPLSLAGSWDNVGLLVEPSPPKYISKLMLTNDLTAAVLEEAKDQTVDLILSYHPPLFAPLKRLTQTAWKERILIECMESRIAVFSPHTSYDAVEGGVNDWLISAFDIKKGSKRPVEIHEELIGGLTNVLEVDIEPEDLKEVRDEVLMSMLAKDSRLRTCKDAVTVTSFKTKQSSELLRLRVECNMAEIRGMVRALNSCKCVMKYSISNLAKGPQPNTGMGRIAELSTPISLDKAVDTVKTYLGLSHVALAKSQSPGNEDAEINTVAVCAGSGSSVLQNVRADLLLTGEMSHHDVLDAVHKGSHVILCHHSNTERGYLTHLRDKLVKVLGSSVDIFISQSDRDPLEIV